MKKLLSILIIVLFLFSCVIPSVPNDPPIIEHEDPPPEDPPEDPPSGDLILFGLYDGENLKFFDGINITNAYTGNIRQADNRKIAIDDVLYYFDSYGEVEQTNWLPVYPEAIVTKESEAKEVIYSDDVFTLERIDPDEAYALGAQYKEYTRIFINSEESGLWYMNEWRVSEVFELGNGDIVALDTMSVYHNLTGANEYWKAHSAGIGIHQFNPGNRTAYINNSTGDYFVSWATNYFNSARWQKSGDTWYSNNGYEWTPAGLIEEANALWNFTSYPYPIILPYGEAPTVVPACTRLENSEHVTYWVECNSGYLFRHIPSIDNLNSITRLYIGDGTRLSGISMASYIDPILVEDILYFHDSGSIMIYNFTTGILSIFSGEMEILPW